MLLDLDRIIVAVDDLPGAAADYAMLLGHEPVSTSYFASMRAADDRAPVRFSLGNTTLELCARSELELPDGEPGREGVAAIVFREDERETDAWLSVPTRGIPIGLARDERDDARPVTQATEDSVVSGLDHVVVSTGDLDAARKLYGQELGLRLALDRPFERRGIQILFFRIAGVTVEVVGPLAGADEHEGGAGAFAGEVDRFGGLAWKIDDVRAMRSRLEAAGVDVSDDRAGHKPGTRVCTVRSHTHGVPTLLIGPDRG